MNELIAAEQLSEFIHDVKPLKHELRFANNPFVSIKDKDTVASHCWRGGLYTLFLDQILDTNVDRQKVQDLVIIHDLTELGKNGTQALGFRNENAKQVADQTDNLSRFSYLPEPMFSRLQSLWTEFIGQKTIESRIAKAIERLESNWTAIESIDAIRDLSHRQKTIDYITGFLGVDPGLDLVIRQQLSEIEIKEIENIIE